MSLSAIPLRGNQDCTESSVRYISVMSLPRFYVSPEEWNPEAPGLSGDEAKHCTQVLRLVEGDALVLFNGQGLEQAAVIDSASKREVVLRAGEVKESTPLRCRIGLGQALPKGKNMELIIQKGTELGVAEVAPLVTTNTIVRLESRDAEKKRAKWQRVAIEACKQCGQNFLPQVMPPRPLDAVLTDVASRYDLLVIASLQPGATDLKSLLTTYSESNGGALPQSAFVLIGPEGDFTEAEVGAALEAGARPMTLGPIILRTETAAIYCLSVLGHELC